jgi:hypothetical protein
MKWPRPKYYVCFLREGKAEFVLYNSFPSTIVDIECLHTIYHLTSHHFQHIYPRLRNYTAVKLNSRDGGQTEIKRRRSNWNQETAIKLTSRDGGQTEIKRGGSNRNQEKERRSKWNQETEVKLNSRDGGQPEIKRRRSNLNQETEFKQKSRDGGQIEIYSTNSRVIN